MIAVHLDSRKEEREHEKTFYVFNNRVRCTYCRAEC